MVLAPVLHVAIISWVHEGTFLVEPPWHCCQSGQQGVPNSIGQEGIVPFHHCDPGYTRHLKVIHFDSFTEEAVLTEVFMFKVKSEDILPPATAWLVQSSVLVFLSSGKKSS
eukprot:TRINITY_DN27758_c0_g1_i1.p1 TRINITY_DN27758_c0_g1~~TRINITY_DN27758_c0_g1_i1.p1  ORF type:complete len:111 (-),score=16.40 TRINITY_DN27758_c0_g1_i1:62-394(-)